MNECNCNAEDYEGCHRVDCPVGIMENKRYRSYTEKCVSCGKETMGKCGDFPACERCYRDGTLCEWMDHNEIEGY